MIKLIIIAIIFGIDGLSLLMLLWCRIPYKALTWLCHDRMGWHKPCKVRYYDGRSFHSKCRICGKEIIKNKKGDWCIIYD